MRARAIQVYVRQKFAGRRRQGDRRGFGFVADDLKAAKKELGQWRAVDVALEGTPSFVKAEFWDRDAWLAAVRSGQTVPAPLLVIEA